jgi:hypothetical protein
MDKNLIPVKGNSGLFRDFDSGAILNCSDNDFKNYLILKNEKIKEIQEMNDLKNKVSELDDLKNDIEEVKNMMKIILSKLDTNS